MFNIESGTIEVSNLLNLKSQNILISRILAKEVVKSVLKLGNKEAHFVRTWTISPHQYRELFLISTG